MAKNESGTTNSTKAENQTPKPGNKSVRSGSERHHKVGGQTGPSEKGPPQNPSREITIHPEIRALIPPQPGDYRARLQQRILAENKCRNPLPVWKEESILLDDPLLLEICEEHGIPYDTYPLSFS